MTGTLTIAWRELRSFAVSPFAYVVAALYLALNGLLFVSDLPGLTEARVDSWMRHAALLTVFVAPLLSMRALAEERRSGSLEVLLSSPVTDAAVVVGKYLGLLGAYTCLLAATAVYPLMIALWGAPDSGPIVAGYVGLLLLGAASLGVGLLASALSRQQIVAAVLGFVTLLVLWVLDSLAPHLGGGEGLLAYLATNPHVEPFVRGIIRPQDAVYYTTVAVVAQVVAAKALESRRWL
ncbi:MAG TPA: ABC transporter permease [Acidimicrobiales bacterium]|nr:ABC transporter permease [Acidimicrobiales bacterium]